MTSPKYSHELCTSIPKPAERLHKAALLDGMKHFVHKGLIFLVEQSGALVILTNQSLEKAYEEGRVSPDSEICDIRIAKIAQCLSLFAPPIRELAVAIPEGGEKGMPFVHPHLPMVSVMPDVYHYNIHGVRLEIYLMNLGPKFGGWHLVDYMEPFKYAAHVERLGYSGVRHHPADHLQTAKELGEMSDEIAEHLRHHFKINTDCLDGSDPAEVEWDAMKDAPTHSQISHFVAIEHFSEKLADTIDAKPKESRADMLKVAPLMALHTRMTINHISMVFGNPLLMHYSGFIIPGEFGVPDGSDFTKRFLEKAREMLSIVDSPRAKDMRESIDLVDAADFNMLRQLNRREFFIDSCTSYLTWLEGQPLTDAQITEQFTLMILQAMVFGVFPVCESTANDLREAYVEYQFGEPIKLAGSSRNDVLDLGLTFFAKSEENGSCVKIGRSGVFIPVAGIVTS